MIELIRSKDLKPEDTLHIASGKSEVRGHVTVWKFTDKDTRQVVLVAPTFDMTSYGETEEKALEMLKQELVTLFEDLVHMSTKKLNEELRKMGWKKDAFRNKDFSSVLVDVEGQLQNFNAVDNKVEQFALVA